MLFATPARYLLKSAVIQSSCSGIDQFVQDFEDDGSDRHEKACQRGRQVQSEKLHYNIAADSQQEIPCAEKDEQALARAAPAGADAGSLDRKSTRLNSSHQLSSYAVFC